MNLKLVSQDNRRDLFEFGSGGTWKICKYIKTKEDCEVGGHLHRKKDELFLIEKGEVFVSMALAGVFTEIKVVAPDTVYIPRHTYHTFKCSAGTVMICLASELHDDNDDIKDKA